MSRWKKVFLWILGLLVALSFFSFFYLFYDEPYPGTNASGLLVTKNTSIPKGESPDIRATGEGKNIVADGIWFKDPTGRTMIQHGINVSGSAKLPFTPR